MAPSLWQLPSPSLPGQFLTVHCTATSWSYVAAFVCRKAGHKQLWNDTPGPSGTVRTHFRPHLWWLRGKHFGNGVKRLWCGLGPVQFLFCTGASYQKHSPRIELMMPRSAFLGSSYWSSNFSTYLKSTDITNGKCDQNMGGSHFHLQSSMACLWIFMPIRKKILFQSWFSLKKEFLLRVSHTEAALS